MFMPETRATGLHEQRGCLTYLCGWSSPFVRGRQIALRNSKFSVPLVWRERKRKGGRLRRQLTQAEFRCAFGAVERRHAAFKKKVNKVRIW